jgi:hypothetical protein
MDKVLNRTQPGETSRRSLLAGDRGGRRRTDPVRRAGRRGDARSPDHFTLPPATDAIAPFRVVIDPTAISRLRQRLALTRWPEKETVDDWSQGVPLATMQDFTAYWRDHYDMTRLSRRLNAFPQFRTRIDGLGIHFIHVRSKHANATPIILTHGWPGSVVEFLKIIGPLTDPEAHGGKAEDAFHVVIPSLPGFGFSDKPTERGWGLQRIAKAWATLMTRLGYSHYLAQGGDWGAGVTTWMAKQHAPGLSGVHLNLPIFFPPPIEGKPTPRKRPRSLSWSLSTTTSRPMPS